jgi:hypothetical protein
MLNRALACAALLALAGEARAFPDSRCVKDASPVPGFAVGRDAAGCLLIDPGTGAPAVRFDFEYPPGSFPAANALPTSCKPSNDCAWVGWGVELDDYLVLQGPSDNAGADAFPFSGRHYQTIYFRDGGVGNTWKCKGGSWTSPTELQRCRLEDSTCAHADGIQIRGQPVLDGWAVFQNFTVANVNDVHVILEMNDPEYVGPPPGFVWQHVKVGYFPDWGVAEDWGADCLAMGDNNCVPPVGGAPRWQLGSNGSTTPFKATWLINSWTHVNIDPNRTAKIIVVNGGKGGPCNNQSGCDGAIGFDDGWPAPLGVGWYDASPGPGPGVCPEGLIAADVHDPNVSSVVVPVYCYTSIERALADVHTETGEIGDCPHCPHARPPFLQLSNSGWEDPPLDNCSQVANDAPLDCDTDRDGYGNACDADYDQDGAVGISDFGTFIQEFGRSGPPGFSAADHNCDGSVGVIDHSIFAMGLAAMAPGPSELGCAGLPDCGP